MLALFAGIGAAFLYFGSAEAVTYEVGEITGFTNFSGRQGTGAVFVQTSDGSEHALTTSRSAVLGCVIGEQIRLERRRGVLFLQPRACQA